MKRTYVKPTTKTVRLLVQQFFAASGQKTEWKMSGDGGYDGSTTITDGDDFDPDADDNSSRSIGRGMWGNM